MKMISENAICRTHKGKGGNKRNSYVLTLDDMPSINLGNFERIHGKRKLFLIPAEALESIESLVDGLRISIDNAAQDAAVERFFEKISLFRGKTGEVALILEPCSKWLLKGLWKVFVVDPDCVREDLRIPLQSQLPGISLYPFPGSEKKIFF